MGISFVITSSTHAQIIADHSRTDITLLTQSAIDSAKTKLHIGYGHTSHGSQIISGMSGLVGFANGGGKGLTLPADIFSWDQNGAGDALHLYEGDGYGEGDLDHDCGYYPNWVNETTEFLGLPDPQTGCGTNHPEFNVIMWSWCGQASGKTEQTMLDEYLLPMSQLELDYPGVTFVYMTGHADGSGEEGNLHQRNQQIRQYCIDNQKVLFDFYDIECYDPDGNYYGDKYVNDNCDYDSDGNGSLDKNWAVDWQNSHTVGVDWFDCGAAHSQSLNANQKAYAIWWLWCSIAGNVPNGPSISITVNGEQNITVGTGTMLNFNLNLSPNSVTGTPADWWLCANINESQWYSFLANNSQWVTALTPSYQAPLSLLENYSTSVTAPSTPCTIEVYFAVDKLDNQPNGPFYGTDKVTVTVE